MSTFLLVALGDSISTAFNAEVPENNLAYSWSTGHASDGRVKSHLQRLRGALPHLQIETSNVAFNGARAANLAGQVQRLGARPPDYVTLLIGANDLFSWVFTPTYEPLLAAFAHDVEATVQALITGNRRVMILLSGIPDQARVVELGLSRLRPAAALSQILLNQPAMLESLRQAYRERWERTNAVLLHIAEKYQANVRFVAKTQRFQLATEHLSSLDMYHPSIAGQRLLADVTWEQGWFP